MSHASHCGCPRRAPLRATLGRGQPGWHPCSVDSKRRRLGRTGSRDSSWREESIAVPSSPNDAQIADLRSPAPLPSPVSLPASHQVRLPPLHHHMNFIVTHHFTEFANSDESLDKPFVDLIFVEISGVSLHMLILQTFPLFSPKLSTDIECHSRIISNGRYLLQEFD